MITTALVKLWEKTAGAVIWDASQNRALFEFDSSFITSGLNIAPHKMPLAEAEKRVFSFPELAKTSFKGLPGLLADALPDKYGNALINAWLAQNGRPAGSMNPVELLCFIGKRAMGALEFEPALPSAPERTIKIELDSLLDIAQKILSGKKDFSASLAKEEEKAIAAIIKMGTSAGGARAKAVVAYNESTNEIRSGQANAPDGFSHWILKFDGVTDLEMGVSSGYGKVEMAYYLMAIDSGIEMMPCKLLQENNRAHFMTKRFDRINNEKVHMQSFYGMMHYDFNDIHSYSYEQLFETARAMRLPYDASEQIYRRMVFNVIARNCDDHTKNFAFLMDKSGAWNLSPAFDVCHAYRPDSIWVSRQSLSVNGKRENIDRNDLLAVAKNMGIKKAKAIIDQLRETAGNWKSYAGKTAVDTALMNAIEKTFLLKLYIK